MKLHCVWEHNGNDTLLYAQELPGAFARGASLEEAQEKMKREAVSYLHWCGLSVPEPVEPVVAQEKVSVLMIRDADSDVLFDTECAPLLPQEYRELKERVLRSAADFQRLYDAIPQKDVSDRPVRPTFYSKVPRTAQEMYDHTKCVNPYYFGEIGAEADAEGSILACRQRGFRALETMPEYLENRVICGSYDEEWSLRKVLRRFLWHDRIHARAMYRMAVRMFGKDAVPDPFCFEE